MTSPPTDMPHNCLSWKKYSVNHNTNNVFSTKPKISSSSSKNSKIDPILQAEQAVVVRGHSPESCLHTIPVGILNNL